MFNFAALLLIPYYEYIFRISTTKDMSLMSLMLSLLFSFGYSAFLAILMRLFKKPSANRFVTALILFVVPVLYLTEFFVYRSFKVFYDVNTIINGAGGVVAGFKADAARLIFCFDGLSRIFLFLLPFILYVLFLRKKDHAMRHSLFNIVYFAVIALVLVLFTGFLIGKIDNYRYMCNEEYNYQNVVEALGFSTGVRLDVKKMISGNGNEIEFEFADMPAFESTGTNGPKNVISNFVPNSEETGEALSRSSLPSPAPRDELTVKAGKNAALEEVLNEITEEETVVAEAEISETPEVEEPAEEVIEEPEPEEVIEVEPPKEEWASYYGVNALDIDFAALAESTSGTKKDLDNYVASQTPSSKNKYTGLFKGKNLIFFSAEAFSGDIIDPELTPTLYRLSTKGIQIPDYYQPAIAGTTGGEYANIFGMIPANGGKSMKEMTAQNTWITIGNRLNDEGYYGKAYHNNSGEVYGRYQTHNRLGYSEGFEAVGNGMEQYLSGSGFPQSDLEMMQGTLPTYIDKQPFNIYYMTVSGHGQYGRKINRMSAKNYERVENLGYSEIVKCYIANNLELEDALTYTVNELERAGIADDTVIVLGADHFPYSLDNDAALGNMPALSELYGYNVTNYIERDHNRLIIWSGCLEDEDPIIVDEPVFSPDILPTLCNLFGVEFDSRLLPGRDIFSDKEALIFTGGYDWKTSLGTYIAKKNEFTPASPDVIVPEGYVDRIKSEVRNRMAYCKGVLSCAYFDHVFGPSN
ncbi:MAG: sulfatase-like hydrolase/transferase [Lachnospiraceae bacterium]|nr:sulfatase-like hydrolase/transferase [Lachnospiraceae bacterium]